MAKVYLSSTLLDLRAERQAITDWLIAAGFQPVHSYVADSETVRESCLEDIAGCDLYILLLGHRFGFQPTKHNPKKLSITQLEFRKAGKLRLPRLAFLRTSVPDIHLSDLNDPDRNRLVQAFRTEVAEALRPAEFKDMAELVAAFSAAILHHVLKVRRNGMPIPPATNNALPSWKRNWKKPGKARSAVCWPRPNSQTRTTWPCAPARPC